MSRKVFISVLGTGFYAPCKYANGQFVSSETRFIQVATLEYLQVSHWSEEDLLLILLTEGARKANWQESIQERRNPRSQELEPYQGLQQTLQSQHLPCRIQEISIPDGKDTEEMWRIFQLLFDALCEGDELYIDLTHSFRYLPMLVLVLSNYGRFLKAISVKHLSYGNYEARDVLTNTAGLIDLLPLAELQEWTFAAANLMQNGDAQTLRNLCRRSLSPLLKDPVQRSSSPSIGLLRDFADQLLLITQSMKGCRALDLIQGESVAKLVRLAQRLDQVVIQPMAPIVQKITSSFQAFHPSMDIINGYRAAEWCFNHQMYQQSLTILHENIVTHLCMATSLDYRKESERNMVNKALHIHSNHRPEEEWAVSSEEEKAVIKKLLEQEELKQLSSTFLVTTNLRNDYNHAGMRSNPATSSTLLHELEKRIRKIHELYLTDPL